MPRVFIPHLPTKINPLNQERIPTVTLQPAAKLGELVVINELPSDTALENFGRSHNMIIDVLHDMLDGPEDYIAFMGDPVLCALAVHEALKNWNVINVLRWDRQRREYDIIRIVTEETS